MTAYLVVDISIHDIDRFMDYVAKVPPFIAKHGGQYVVRGSETITKEGDWRPERLVVIKFPDRAHAESFLDDPDYQPVAAIRHESATTNLVLAEGLDS